MSARLTPFEKLRKKRARKKFLKKLIALLNVGSTIYFTYMLITTPYFNNLADNLIEIFQGIKKGSGYPFELDASVIKDSARLDNSVVVLYDDMISITNKNGHQSLDYKHKLLDPRIVTNSKDALIYEQLGTHMQLYSKTKKRFEYKFQYPIYTATISDSDKIAVSTGSNRYLSNLEVFNIDNKKLFCWNSAEKYVTSISFSHNSNNLAVSFLGVENGTYKSTLMLFNINKEDPVAKIEVDNDIILSVEYKSSDNIYIIYRNMARIIDSKGNIKSEYKFNGKKLKAFNNKIPKHFILIFDNYDRLANNKLIVLDSLCKEKISKVVTGNVRDVDYQGNNIYILMNDFIYILDMLSDRVQTQNIDMDTIKLVLTPGHLYTVNNSKIEVFDNNQ